MRLKLTPIPTTQRVVKHLDNVSIRIMRQVRAAAKSSAIRIENNARQDILMGTKTGRWYGSHQASAPGESPANWTGLLVETINRKPVDGYQLLWEIGANAEYAGYLEEGTRRMAPRPVWVPSLNEEADRFIDKVSRIVGGVQ